MSLPEIGKVYESRDMSGPSFEWQKRFIMIDHFGKVIYISVKHLINGELNFVEFQNLKNGNWKDYLPNGLSNLDIEIRNVLKALVDSGYQVRPMACFGMSSDDFNVFTLTDIQSPVYTQFSS